MAEVNEQSNSIESGGLDKETAAEAQAFSATAPDEGAATHGTRLNRMIGQARDGKTAQKVASAAAGRLFDADEAPEFADRAQAGLTHRKRPAGPPHGPGGNSDNAWEPDGPERPRGGRRGRRRMGRLTRKLIGAVVLLALLVAAYLIFWPRLQAVFKPDFNISLPDSVQGLLPDEKMGYNAVDFSNAILGESREQKELVVMEQDVEVTSQISQDLLNISLFAKQKIIHSFGTGVYTVNLEKLSAKDIVFDEATGIITVTVPHAKLGYVSVDVEKTEFEDTRKALLAVGDIKLTAEQKHVLDQDIDASLHEKLENPALLTKADEIALVKVREIFQAPVSALSDAFLVKVVME